MSAADTVRGALRAVVLDPEACGRGPLTITHGQYALLVRALAALDVLEQRLEAAEEAVERGRIFERVYNEVRDSWSPARQEWLDSVQSAFIDAYTDALSAAGSGDRSTNG